VRLAVVVSFLDEERHLPTLLGSIAAQTRPPDRLLLVDDGSRDGSFAIAERFAAAHPYARAMRRPPRPPETDRLASAAELRSFQWGVEQLDGRYDIVAKLDADLDLAPRHFETVERAFAADPGLGVAGTYLSAPTPSGALAREYNPPHHVRGPNKFYRRACLEQIDPVPAILGWDAIDEIRARRAGWGSRSLELPEGETVHLRPTGAHDGVLRAYRRWGRCAWGYGADPLQVLVGGVRRLRRRPYGLCGIHYVAGWAIAGARRLPRAEPETRAFFRAEQRARVLRRRLPRARTQEAA
jgi:poly-beta-1,6-N-acetyl-D-glucosamine synthase